MISISKPLIRWLSAFLIFILAANTLPTTAISSRIFVFEAGPQSPTFSQQAMQVRIAHFFQEGALNRNIRAETSREETLCSRLASSAEEKLSPSNFLTPTFLRMTTGLTALAILLWVTNPMRDMGIGVMAIGAVILSVGREEIDRLRGHLNRNTLPPNDEEHFARSRILIRQALGIDIHESYEALPPNAVSLLRGEKFALVSSAEQSRELGELLSKTPQGEALVLGVGYGFDIPLLEILLTHKKVVWLDIDKSAMGAALTRLKQELVKLEVTGQMQAELVSRLKIQEIDMTDGLNDSIPMAMRQALRSQYTDEDRLKAIDTIYKNAAKKPLAIVPGRYRSVISSLFCSQLEQAGDFNPMWSAVISPNFYPTYGAKIRRAFEKFQISTYRKHLAQYKDWVLPGGVVYWSDHFAGHYVDQVIRKPVFKLIPEIRNDFAVDELTRWTWRPSFAGSSDLRGFSVVAFKWTAANSKKELVPVTQRQAARRQAAAA